MMERAKIDVEAFVDAVLKVLGRSQGTRDRATGYSVKVDNVQARAIVGANYDRTKLVIQNESASDIEIGDVKVRFGEGIKIRADGGAYIDDVAPFLGEWYAIANVAGPLDVRVRDES